MKYDSGLPAWGNLYVMLHSIIGLVAYQFLYVNKLVGVSFVGAIQITTTKANTFVCFPGFLFLSYLICLCEVRAVG